MKIRHKWIPQHHNGHFITLRCEPTDDESHAARFPTAEDCLIFLNGIHGPREPLDYKPVKLRITYELESEEDVQQERVDQQDSGSSSRFQR